MYALVISHFVGEYFSSTEVTDNMSELDEGRNEGSTPRSFVHCNAGCGLIQEAKTERKQREKVVKVCMLRLVDEGFYVRDIDDIHDDQVPISIIRFQLRQGIETTGERC